MPMKRTSKGLNTHPAAPDLEYARIMGKAHRLDVLKALASAAEGLTFSYLSFKVVGTSGTNLILKELLGAGLIIRDPKDDLYRITADGRKALSLAESLAALGATRSGERGAGS